MVSRLKRRIDDAIYRWLMNQLGIDPTERTYSASNISISTKETRRERI